MEQSNHRKTDFSFSTLMHRLYGQKSFLELKSFQDLSLAKKYYKKLISTITLSIGVTIQIADQDQKDRLLYILTTGENNLKKCKSFSDLDQAFIAFETELIFQLLGFVPNRSSENLVVNKKSNWNLNTIRQIQYVQNKRNRELFVFKIIQERHLNKFRDWSDFVNIYRFKCDDDIDKLMEYLKINQNEIFQEINNSR